MLQYNFGSYLFSVWSKYMFAVASGFVIRSCDKIKFIVTVRIIYANMHLVGIFLLFLLKWFVLYLEEG